jgi:hypothetical protein
VFIYGAILVFFSFSLPKTGKVDDVTEGFIEIFENAKEKKQRVTLVSEEISDYFSACCKERDATIQLLESSGFVVGSHREAKE